MIYFYGKEREEANDTEQSGYNKDDNIHSCKTLKSGGDKWTITLVECQNLTSRELICKSKQNCT